MIDDHSDSTKQFAARHNFYCSKIMQTNDVRKIPYQKYLLFIPFHDYGKRYFLSNEMFDYSNF